MFKGSLKAATSEGLILSAEEWKLLLLVYSNWSPAFRLAGHLPSAESSQQGNGLAFLKNHPICLTTQKP